MSLETIGLNFNRVPLPEHVATVQGQVFMPEILSGKKRIIQEASKTLAFEAPFRKAFGDDYLDFVRTEAGTKINIEFNEKDVVWLKYRDHKDIIEHINVHVKAFEEGTLILDYLSEEPIVHHGLMNVHVEEGGKLHLIKLQNNHLDSQYIDQVKAEVEASGEFNVVDLQLGSEHIIVNYDTNLKGFKSHCDYKSMYLAGDERGLDLSFTANHLGKKTTSDILGKGVLSGKAKKVFRGTLHFERGASQSVGKEQEVVLLLSDDVKSDSIPALMCTEDDVIGEHGASIGQLDENRLFYLMSRGLDEKAAKLLVIQSSFKEILERIESDELKAMSMAAVDRSLEDVV